MAEPERDPYTGIMTTGHEWNGIKELVTPVPGAVKFFLFASTICAIILWILFPTWPYGVGYTKGVLGTDQRNVIEDELRQSTKLRASWEDKFRESDLITLQTDSTAMALASNHGARLFADNCAVCHGEGGAGGPGFPSLIDDQWLWGGEPEIIMETIRVGINTNHEDTRESEMIAFGDQELLGLEDRRSVAAYVRSLSGLLDNSDKNAAIITSGKDVFADNCASCHGDNAEGDQDVGAPNLTDENWIYGSDVKSVADTLLHGRKGVMPYWEQRLSETDRKLLTLYILSLGKRVQ